MRFPGPMTCAHLIVRIIQRVACPRASAPAITGHLHCARANRSSSSAVNYRRRDPQFEQKEAFDRVGLPQVGQFEVSSAPCLVTLMEMVPG